MWVIFWLSNIHFAIEAFGALICFAIAWLFLDAYILKREGKVFLKSLGFFLFGCFEVIYASFGSNLLILQFSTILAIIGFILIFLSLYAHRPLIPGLKIIFFPFPTLLAGLKFSFFLSAVFLGAITIISLKQYKLEQNKSLKSFCIGFFCFTCSFLLAILNLDKNFDINWYLEHIFKLCGLISLGIWFWQYLRFRLKEELLLIFLSFAVGLAIIVAFIFQSLFLASLEHLSMINISSKTTLLKNYFTNLYPLKSPSLIIRTDKNRKIIFQKGSTLKINNYLREDYLVDQALQGHQYFTFRSDLFGKFSFQTAFPIYNKNNQIDGVKIEAVPISISLIDRLSKIVGLELFLFERNKAVITTLWENQKRQIGFTQENAKINYKVLNKKEEFTGRVNLLGKPYLMTFLPLETSEGKVIGMIAGGIPQNNLLKVLKDINKISFLLVVLVTILGMFPIYILAKKFVSQLKV